MIEIGSSLPGGKALFSYKTLIMSPLYSHLLEKKSLYLRLQVYT